MLPPYQVYDVAGGQRVALIGVATETTPTLVSPTGIEDVTVIDEADAVNRWVPVLQQQGIRAVGVLIHEGGEQSGPSKANPNGCDTLTGPIVDINDRLDARVDLIVCAHTHSAYNCLLPAADGHPKAGHLGGLLRTAGLRHPPDDRPSNGDVDRTATYRRHQRRQSRGPRPTPGSSRSSTTGSPARPAPRPRPAGTATADINRAGLQRRPGPGRARPRVEPRQPRRAGTARGAAEEQYGNPGRRLHEPRWLRTDILAAGEVTYGELFNVQPFGNNVNTITMTGAEIEQLLEQQFPTRRSARPSSGSARPRASPTPTTCPCRRRPHRPVLGHDRDTRVDPATSYRVAANSFLTAGGDSFSAFLGRDGLDERAGRRRTSCRVLPEELARGAACCGSRHPHHCRDCPG